MELQVYALTGGVAPLMPSIDVSQLKRRPPSDEKVFDCACLLECFFVFEDKQKVYLDTKSMNQMLKF